MKLLEGKVALITGSSSGIGQGIAKKFAEEGSRVVINYSRSAEGADVTLAMVQEAGSDGIIVQADVTRTEDIRKLIDAAYEKFGALDILVNNAGMEKKAPFTEVLEADYDRVMAVNLRGPFFLTQYFVQKLQTAKMPGRIINISSVHEDMAFPGFTSYCVSKGGMRMFMRNLAVELGPMNITINNIAPGAIQTPINKNLLQDQGKLDALLMNIPLKRLGTTEDIAELAAFLASDKAGYITGSTYVIDGGLMRNYHEQ
ncbi:MAG: glucose 1-dehydrogenase [Silvibacterium sp.]|nr:glucose 1-dehydrogenase [Silvibacterium sp.]